MRLLLAIAFLAPSTLSFNLSDLDSPFLTPLNTDNTTNNNFLELFLQKRAGCPSNYDSCSTFAAADKGACCTSGSTCTTDSAHNIACCPVGAKCTGSLTYASTTSTGAIVLGGSTTTDAFLTATTTSTSTPGSAPSTTTGSASFVYNGYFPYPYIPTSYVNAAACTSAYSICSSNYAICTADLQGASYAVTIDSPNGGVTVAAASGTYSLPPSSAASVCSSLSSEACWGLQTSNCAQFGDATQTASTSASAVGTFVVGNGAVRQTGVVGAVGVGFGLGVLGQFV